MNGSLPLITLELLRCSLKPQTKLAEEGERARTQFFLQPYTHSCKYPLFMEVSLVDIHMYLGILLDRVFFITYYLTNRCMFF